MPEIVCTLETVTPAFIGGALRPGPVVHIESLRREALRPPVLKGLLRFWWRALQGAVDVGELAAREGRVFGDVAQGQGLRIIPVETTGVDIKSAGLEVPGGSVIAYGGYGVINVKGKTTRPALWPGAKFRFRLLHRNQEALEEVARAVWLLGAFGGYGSRSRRGFGSLHIASWDDVSDTKPPWPFPGDATSPEALAGSLREWRLAQPFPKGQPELPPWTAWTEQSVVRVYKAVHRTPFDALQQAIGDLKRFRGLLGVPGFQSGQHGPDHDLVYDFHKGEPVTRPPRRAGFGLPHNYQLTHGGTRTGGQASKITIKPDLSSGRRGSPLMFHVTRIRGDAGGSQYVAVVAFLPAQFLPDDVRIVMTNARSSQSVHVPYKQVSKQSIYGVILDYFNGCQVPTSAGVKTWPGLAASTWGA